MFHLKCVKAFPGFSMNINLNSLRSTLKIICLSLAALSITTLSAES